MSNAYLAGVVEWALLGQKPERLRALLEYRSGAITCGISWPLTLDGEAREIVRSIGSWGSPFSQWDGIWHTTIALPREVRGITAGHEWFVAKISHTAKMLPPDWRLYSPRGKALNVQHALGEPLAVIRKIPDDDWVNGEECLLRYLDALNHSPLCQTGTVRYVADGSIQVLLSQAALEQEPTTYLLQLAELYT